MARTRSKTPKKAKNKSEDKELTATAADDDLTDQKDSIVSEDEKADGEGKEISSSEKTSKDDEEGNGVVESMPSSSKKNKKKQDTAVVTSETTNDEVTEVSPSAMTSKEDDDVDGEVENEVSSPKEDTKKKEKQLKKKKEKQLRSRNSGMISISINGAADGVDKPKKIIFADDFDDETENAIVEYGSDKEEKDDQLNVSELHDANDEDDEGDDAVEEVKSSAARAEAMRQRKVERITKKDDAAGKKKKRKRQEKKVDEDLTANEETEENVELTDDFFDKIDSEIQSERDRLKEEKRKQRKIDTSGPKIGRHTTFTSGGGSEGDALMAYQAGHGIEVVPLGDDDQYVNQLDLSTKLGTKPSKAAIVYARGSLLNREEEDVDAVQQGPQRKNKPKRKDEQLKRSKRMKYHKFEKIGAPALSFCRSKN
mmetsp:Transcript_10380/g.15322  ORF Transcript_10380/g.15322 Transcript_10380/m.15322 type:complete len:425 (+) Transcript_10380:215-1489(+)